MKTLAIVQAAALVLLAGGIVASPHSVQAQAPPSQWVIVPGEGWGPIRLGMTEQEVYAILGPPVRVRGESSHHRWVRVREHVEMTFGDPRAFVAIAPPFRLSSISLDGNPVWRTPEGVRIGSSLEAVVDAYGDVCQDAGFWGGHPPVLTLNYFRGIRFWVDLSTKKVVEIIVIKAEVPTNSQSVCGEGS